MKRLLDQNADLAARILRIAIERPRLFRAWALAGWRHEHVWELHALDHQRPKTDDFTVWMLLGGRGAGKTRAGAEWVREFVDEHPEPARIALVSETYADGREVMIDGESGLAHVGPEERRPTYHPSRRRLEWPSGSVGYVFSSEDPDGLRGHQFHAAWCDEAGVPAVDKGANAPNVFVDPKSSESALPPFSNGARDDLIQRRALEAVHDYWRTNNETGPSGPMIETDRLYVYAYDARPYPFFPARADVWGDAANWEKGHWLNGRLTRAPLDALVKALCAEAGVTAVDTSSLKGSLAGYILDRPLSPRATIDPLADVFQFDMVETADALRFQPRGVPNVLTLAEEALVDDGEAAFSLTTAQKADLPTAVRLGYIDEGGDHNPAIAEARSPHADDIREIGVELPAVMDEGTASSRARSLLADASVMRETAAFALPPSLLALEPGDAIVVDLGSISREFRILSINDGAARKVEAVRVSPAVYDASPASGGFRTPASAPVFGKPVFELMNLPLLKDDDDPAAPYLAAFASPWPGAIALYRGTSLAATATARAVLGRLDAALAPGVFGRWDERSLRVRLRFGALSSRSEEDVFAGANAAAVETAEGWEVLQFRDATLGLDGVWTLKGLLRGQGGTERQATAGAAANARFVLLNAAVIQPPLPLNLRGLSFDWSAGPADDLPTAPTFRTETFTAEARGLAPLSPVHLRAAETAAGDVVLTWIRRTRTGGDSWTGEDVPLAEAFERYRVEVLNGATVVRTAEVATPACIYTAAQIAADFPGGRPPLTLRVAQLSDAVGVGEWGEVAVE